MAPSEAASSPRLPPKVKGRGAHQGRAPLAFGEVAAHQPWNTGTLVLCHQKGGSARAKIGAGTWRGLRLELRGGGDRRQMEGGLSITAPPNPQRAPRAGEVPWVTSLWHPALDGVGGQACGQHTSDKLDTHVEGPLASVPGDTAVPTW